MAYDFVTALGKLIRLSAVKFLLDFMMMSAFSLSFFSLLIGYNNGQIRVYFLLISLFGFLLYIVTIHKILAQAFDKALSFCKKKQKWLTNCLKKCKKS
ncbi:MAG: spore cortex biosynthesis protein YabQ [Eubacterium sp.]|nr:spore cortex biosynthesis protein YabQ [Eubacterium sp.]